MISNRMLNKSMTTKSDLEKMLKIYHITAVVEWAYNFDKNKPYMILNMGVPMLTGGTHWVAVDNVKKRYFDPLGASPPEYIPKDYQFSNIQIQDFNFGRCGQYCVLYLKYSMDDEVDRFFNLFTISNL
jgi:hypothetical protein